MPDIDFNAMQQAFEARQRKAAEPVRDAATHNAAQSLLDHVQTIAKGGMSALEKFGAGAESFGKGLVESSPIGAEQAASSGQLGKVPGITGAALSRMESPEQFAKTAKGPYGHMQTAVVTGMSAAEFWGFGKVAGLAGEALEASPALSKVSPMMSSIIKNAAKSIGVSVGDEEAAIVGRRVLASSVVGGGLTGAASAGEGKIRGQKPQLGANIALGTLFGAVAGVLPGGHAQMDARTVDDIHNSLLSFGEKSDVQKFSNVATAWGKSNGYSRGEAMRRWSRVMLGMGSDVDRISIQQLADSKPELFEGKLLAGATRAASSGKAEFKVPYPEEIDAMMSKMPGRAGDAELFSSPFEDMSIHVEPKWLPGEKVPGEYSSAGVFVGKPTLAGTPVESRIYRSQLPSDARIASKESRAAYQSALPDEPVKTAPEVVRYTLPIGSDVRDIPAAPKLTPPNLTPVQREIFEHASGADWQALESRVTKNQNSLVALGKMVVHGVLEPKHINNPEVASTVSSFVREIAEDIDPKTNKAQYDMLQEHANAFDDRAARLRGSEVRPDNMFVREPESGDIVRTVEVGPGRVAIVDKRGGVAVMDAKDAPSHVLKASLDEILGDEKVLPAESPAFQKFIAESQAGTHRAARTEEALAREFAARLERDVPTGKKLTSKAEKAARGGLTETEKFGKQQRQAAKEARIKVAKLDSANDLKAIEAALLGKKAPNVEPPPTPGMHPVADAIRDRITKMEKGAITFGRGKRVNDSFAGMLANKLGGELWQVKEGFVTKLPSGEERMWPTDDAAYEYLKRFTSLQRMVNEREQVLEESVSHLDPKALNKKLVRVGAKATRLPVTNIREAAQLAKQISSLEGAESPTLTQRLHPVADPGTALKNRFIRQHAVLMQMGEGGQQLANLAKQRGATKEMLSNYVSRRIIEPLRLLKKMGYTVTQIENRNVPPEALDLYRSSFGAASKEVYDTMEAMGGDVAPLISDEKEYAHHWFQFKGEDIPGELLDDARKMGIANDAAGLAEALNDPESTIARPQGKADLNNYLSRIQWAREKATSVAHALETERRGNVGYSDDLEVMGHKYVDSISNRLADVVTFGPKDEAINSNLAKIADTFPGRSVYVATGIMNDVRGKVYIPMSPVTRMAGSGLRLWLGSAGPKHIFQNAITWEYFGTPKFMKDGIATALHGVFFGETAENARMDAATVGWTGQQLGEYPDQFLKEGSPENVAKLEEWAGKMGLPKMSRWLGNAGTASLHVFLNAGRINAYRTATNAFPKYLSKALAGNEEALSMISEVYKAKVTPEFLQQQVKNGLTNAMKSRFGKAFADIEGMTYRPEDYPAISRSQEGRELTRFKVFRWNLFHNLFQSINDPNIPFKTRVKRFGRLMMAVPVLGSLDPTIRHKLGMGTIDSETAYDAWTRWTKDKGNLGKAAYMMVMLAAHGGVFGLADDLIQGWNLKNPAIMERATTLNPAIVAPATQAFEASARAANGALNHKPKEVVKAATDLGVILSPSVGGAVARKFGGKKPVRLPKKMLIRKALGAGP